MLILTRKFGLMAFDIIAINAATVIALLLRFDGGIPVNYINVYLHSFILITLIKIAIFYMCRLYRSIWQYASITELLQVFLATAASSLTAYVLSYYLKMQYPRTVYIISWLLTFILVGGIRISYRIAKKIKRRLRPSNAEAKKRVMVIGAGDAASMVIRELKFHHELMAEPVVLVDDNRWKHNLSIHGIPVKGDRTQIKHLAQKFRIDEIIVAIPSAGKKEISELLNICKETKCKLKTLPGVYEIIGNKVSVKNVRDVSIEDLLGRDEIKLNTSEIAGYLENETVLVTGGGGSIGSELCRQIAKYNPKKLIILDIYENNAYDLQNELLHTYKNKINLEVIIASVRDKVRLEEIFDTYKPGVVFHAAAHKHVPLMEANPSEAVKNNVFGTLNTAQCADKYGAKKFVMISTDKAVNPTNIMGATKRLAEMIVQSMDKHSRTEFVAVRFGNVLGSNGSVIPLFKKQIAHGGPVTVTHPEITRFFMTIPEAVRLVIQAGAMAQGGEVFVLNMGQPVKIVDLAKDLIRLSGFEPGRDIKIVYTGLRPGEKLYEELLLDEEGIEKTRHEKIFIGKPLELSYQEVLLCLKALENSLEDSDSVRECMAKVVPTYRIDYSEAAVVRG